MSGCRMGRIRSKINRRRSSKEKIMKEAWAPEAVPLVRETPTARETQNRKKKKEEVRR